MATIAAAVVAFFGLLVGAMSVYGLIYPRPLLILVGEAVDSGTGWRFAIGVRLLLGVALLLAAPVSAWPLVFRAIGALTIVAAIVILLVGPREILSLLAWIERRSDLALRAWLTLGVGFGTLLVYGTYAAFIP